MTRSEMKLRARSLILTNPPRPHPCLVTLVLLAFIWIVNYLAQKIGGSSSISTQSRSSITRT